MDVQVRICRLDPAATVPSYAHPGDAGLDLATLKAFRLAPGERAAISTGLAIEIPAGWVGLVHPRSGLARDYGLTVANAPGTIDSGYRGEVQVLMVNLGTDPVTIDAGQRIAQLLLQPVGTATIVEVEALAASPRGDSGFGSTGR